MGKHMATNLIQAGLTLIVWNRIKSKMNGLIKIGATGVNSPRNVAQRPDVIIKMISDSPDVEAITLGENG